ncbi:50S ribosomal protein L13 [bacterium]|nr:50S ribosomal protein L13 [bacterium]
MKRQKYTIDVEGKPLGRVATEIAKLLRGKQNPDFSPNEDKGSFVIVKNIRKIKLTGKKLEEKIYRHHTGFPGGLKEVKAQKIFRKDPQYLLKKAVLGMLPKNKLRERMIQRLKIT